MDFWKNWFQVFLIEKDTVEIVHSVGRDRGKNNSTSIAGVFKKSYVIKR